MKGLTVLLAVLAFIGVLLITRSPGPGLDPDSASYLGAAESFVHGDGLRIPMADWQQATPTSPLSHFPPGFSALIAVLASAGVAPVQSARLVEALAAAITIGAIVHLTGTAIGLLGASLLALALMLTRPLVMVHLQVLSEPVFLCLVSLVLMSLVRSWPPLAGGLLAALAVMTRYAGVSVTGGVVIWQLIQPGTARRRLARAAIAGTPTALLAGAWVLRTHRVAGSQSIREFGVFGGLVDSFLQGLQTISAWLVPTSDEPTTVWVAAGLLVTAALAAVVVAGLRAARSRALHGDVPATATRVMSAAGVLVASYLVVLVASRLLADPGIPFDERILAPAILLLTTICSVAIAAGWPGWPTLPRVPVGVALVAWAVASALASHDEVQWALDHGVDFAGEEWRTSPTIAWVRANAPRAPLVTTWPCAIYFHLHRASWQLPDTDDHATLAAFVDSVAARHALVVAFDAPNPDAMPAARLDSLGLRRVAKLDDGAVYESR